MKWSPVASFLLAIAGSASVAAAETLKVPSEAYPTIQSAVDVASGGDVILVSKGVYAETVTITEKVGLTIKGKGFPTIQPGAAVGISISSSEAIVITGLEVYQATTGVQVVSCAEIEISKMVISGSSTFAVALSDSSQVLVSRCQVNGSANSGVFDDSSDDVTVEKCSFVDIGNVAVFLSSYNVPGDASERAIVSKNRIEANAGIHAGGEDILVEKNRVTATGGYGIYFDSSSSPSNGTVTKNVVSTTGNSGIQVYGDNFDISRNRLTGGGIQENGYSQVVDHNVVTGGQFGIYINGSSTTVTNNTLKGSEVAGISLNNYFNPITGNKVIGSQGNGIVINSSGAGPFEGNKVTGSAGTGIHVGASFITLTGNKVSGSGNFGFYVTVPNVTFSGNKASGSGIFDLADINAPGANTYDDTNKFGTSQIPFSD